jgi:hypothetical protein
MSVPILAGSCSLLRSDDCIRNMAMCTDTVAKLTLIPQVTKVQVHRRQLLLPTLDCNSSSCISKLFLHSLHGTRLHLLLCHNDANPRTIALPHWAQNMLEST